MKWVAIHEINGPVMDPDSPLKPLERQYKVYVLDALKRGADAHVSTRLCTGNYSVQIRRGEEWHGPYIVKLVDDDVNPFDL